MGERETSEPADNRLSQHEALANAQALNPSLTPCVNLVPSGARIRSGSDARARSVRARGVRNLPHGGV